MPSSPFLYLGTAVAPSRQLLFRDATHDWAATAVAVLFHCAGRAQHREVTISGLHLGTPVMVAVLASTVGEAGGLAHILLMLVVTSVPNWLSQAEPIHLGSGLLDAPLAGRDEGTFLCAEEDLGCAGILTGCPQVFLTELVVPGGLKAARHLLHGDEGMMEGSTGCDSLT